MSCDALALALPSAVPSTRVTRLETTRTSAPRVITIDVRENRRRCCRPRCSRSGSRGSGPSGPSGASLKVKVLAGLHVGNTVAVPSCGGGGGTGVASGNAGLVVCRRAGRRPRGWLSRSNCPCSDSAKCASESCFMFMFRTKRSALVKRLWNARVRRDNEARREAQDAEPGEQGRVHEQAQAQAGPEPKQQLRNSLFKRLSEPQLETLLQAVESRGANLTKCVPLQRELQLGEPHLLCCQIWRWPELRQGCELRRLPACQAASSPDSVCCNPYHWSRLCKPESPPPPYCRFSDERLKPEDRAPSEGDGDYGEGEERLADPMRGDDDPEDAPEPQRPQGVTTSSLAGPTFRSPPPRHGPADPEHLQDLQDGAPGRTPPRWQRWQGSLTTNGEGEPGPGPPEWCRLAYWELAGRVGRQFPVQGQAVNVSSAAEPAGQGLCLATLAQHAPLPTEPAVKRTRAKIGLGVTLSMEADGVWAYNRSENPIFVNSPTLDDPESRTLLVYRVPPGHCLNIFRADTPEAHWARWQRSNEAAHSGPVDPRAVRISFAKGWGPKYSRQEVTACPCWLEVLLQRPCAPCTPCTPCR